MKDVFISYASENRETAQRVAAGLEASGISVWWDRHIQVGSEWDKTIEEALNSAKCVVVLWTAQAKRSRWVRAEVRASLKKILPVMLEPDSIPLPFTGIQALQFLGWHGEAESKNFDIFPALLIEQLADEVEAAIEPQVADRSRVDSPIADFQVIDNLHSPDFRGPRYGSSRKHCFDAVQYIPALS